MGEGGAASGRIVVIGEAIVDLVPEPAENRAGAPVYRAYPGGSPANVAVGLGRLGVPVSYAGRLATDGFGGLLREHLAGSDVDLSTSVAATEPATLAVVSLAADGGASYSFYATGTADWQWTPDELPAIGPETAAVQAGSLGLAVPPGGEVVAAWLRALHARRDGPVVCVDPNARPTLVGSRAEFRSRVEGWVTAAHLVKVSVEDLAWAYPEEPPLAVARRWARLPEPGPLLVVVTLGAEGSLAVRRSAARSSSGATPSSTSASASTSASTSTSGSGSGVVAGELEVRRPVVPASVVDTVGAGDAFTAGLLERLRRRGVLTRAGLGTLDATELAGALDAGAEFAAATVARPGADPPWRRSAQRAPERTPERTPER